VHTDRLADAVVGSRHAQPVTAECLAGGADGVQSVGLGAVLALAGRPVELDDPLATPAECCGEAPAVAGGALDDPGTLDVDAVGVDEVDGVVVAVSGRGEATLGETPEVAASTTARVIQSRSGSTPIT
jgi:hypothetical protein